VNALLTISALLVHALACYGWGRGLERVLRLDVDNPAVSVALGLACALALGGPCNLLGIAYAPVLWAIVASGVGLAGLAIASDSPPRSAAVPAALLVLVICCALLVGLLVVSTLVPPWAFNYHDDYQKYFAHPARMLQTGSLRGSSGSALGFETLGGQAFLHGFVLSLAGFDALNAVDLGFAWPLCIALAGLGPCRDGWQAVTRMLAVVAVIALNPQVVNISATYSASALCLAWLELGRCQRLVKREQLRAFACASGLLFAALCSLKSTFVLLCALAYGLTTCALWIQGSLRRAVQWASPTLGVLLFALLPWLAMHARLYLRPASLPSSKLLHTLATPFRVDLLSLEPDLYGGDSFAMYSFVACVCVAIAWYAWHKAAGWPAYLLAVAAASLSLCYVLMLVIVAPRSQGAVTLMRLCVPVFIAIVPATINLAAQLTAARKLVARCALLLFALAMCVPFARGVAVRFQAALGFGSILAFPGLAQDEDYVRYNYDVLYGTFQRRTSRVQAAVPAGAPLIAYINTPFWLDFTRNPVADIEVAGLATPWASIPEAEYILWELNGFATIQLIGYQLERDRPGLLQARIGDAGLRLTHVLIQQARSGTVLYNDGNTMVLRLPKPSTLGEAYRATTPTRR